VTAKSKSRSISHSERCVQARDLRACGLTWERVGQALDPPVTARQAQNLAKAAPAVEPEPQEPTQASTPPPGEVLGIFLERAGPVAKGRAYPRDVMRHREKDDTDLVRPGEYSHTQGKVLVNRVVVSAEQRGPNDGIQAARADMDEIAERAARQHETRVEIHEPDEDGYVLVREYGQPTPDMRARALRAAEQLASRSRT
jgi:hypothetical protein